MVDFSTVLRMRPTPAAEPKARRPPPIRPPPGEEAGRIGGGGIDQGSGTFLNSNSSGIGTTWAGVS